MDCKGGAMDITEKQVLDALRSVLDPDLNRDVVSLGFIKDIKINGGSISFKLELTTPACPLKAQLKAASEDAVKKVGGVKEVVVDVTSRVVSHRVEEKGNILPGVKNIIAVASGKG